MSLDPTFAPFSSRFGRRAVLHLAAASAAALAWPAAHARPAGAPRLVTIGGAITEIVYLLGMEASLVGTDTTSLYPAAASKTPKVGYMRALSAEGLLSLKPDAIITTTEAGPPVVLDQVRSAGVKLEVVASNHRWEDVQAKIEAVGRAAAREAQARALQARLDAEWTAAMRQVAATGGRKPRVLFVLAHGANPQVSGEKTAANAMIQYAGGVNCLQGAFNGYRPMNAEALASAAPDIVLTSTQSLETNGGAERFWSRPELALTPAYRKRALVTLDALLLLGFGPRMPQAVRETHERFAALMA